MRGTARDESAPLPGLEEEQRLLVSLLDGIVTHGQAPVLRDEPRIGKSRLLSKAARQARERRMTILTATGAGAQRVLFPLSAPTCEPHDACDTTWFGFTGSFRDAGGGTRTPDTRIMIPLL
jgi:hypothetical protein